MSQAVSRMSAALQHRGPDGEGAFSFPRAVLASRRLAIVDLDGGAQPVFDESRTICAIFNGEILNHDEIRRWLQSRGHRFRSRCDSEVIVHLYEEEGEAMVHRLEGQFAFAVWDAPRRRLFMARDRFGICPLYYTRIGNVFAFASEIKAILAANLGEFPMDEDALAEVACMGFVIAPRTMFRSISSLPPAHTLVLEEDNFSIRRYWDLHFPRIGERPVKPLRFYVDGLVEHVERAVSRTLMADVPIGTFLSGGIDSAVVAAVAARLRGNPLPAFSIGSAHRTLDEREDAARVAASIGAPLETILGDEDLIGRSFQKLIEHAECPVLRSESAALMALAGRARESVRVVLTGEGADEAFAGYRWFRHLHLFEPLNARAPGWLRRLASPTIRTVFGTNSVFREKDRAAILAAVGCFPAQVHDCLAHREAARLVFNRDRLHRVLDHPCWNALNIDSTAVVDRYPLDQSLYVGYRGTLPNYLLGPHGDRALMAHSVEGRYPFLDRQLAEFAAGIPPELKLRRGTEKFVFRRAARAWLGKNIPAPRKRGLTTPIGTPFVSDDAPQRIRDLLEPDTLASYGYFDPALVARLVADLRASPQPTGISNFAVNLVVSTQIFHYLFLRAN